MIKCILIDDEPLALQQLMSYAEQTPEIETVAACQSAKEALEVLNNERVDAMFIDISMPDLNGLDFVRSLEAPPLVVFTTAYSKYAVEGFQVSAIDYLLKPFGLDEFRRAVSRVKQQIDLRNAAVSLSDEDDCIFIKTEYKVVRVPIADILYIEAMSEYLRIHFCNGARPITALLSMKKMEERLPSSTFMRTHRSYIVNLKKIREVTKNHIIMGPTVSLPIGDLYKDGFMAYINRKFLSK